LSATDRYSLFADAKLAAVPILPVALVTVLLSDNVLDP
jgi:hypothetical protein